MHVRTDTLEDKLAKSVWLERERDAQRPPTAFIRKASPGQPGGASFMEPVGMRTDPWKAFYGYSDDEATLSGSRGPWPRLLPRCRTDLLPVRRE